MSSNGRIDFEKLKENIINSQDSNASVKVPNPSFNEDQNYVFISYSHKDYKSVYCDLVEMYKNGVRFWYDSNIVAGDMWDETVKRALVDERCSGVIFYISENSFLSKAVYKEIELALGDVNGCESKIFFAVNLSPFAEPDRIRYEISKNHSYEELEAVNHLELTRRAFPNNGVCINKGVDPATTNHIPELMKTIQNKFGVISNVGETGEFSEGAYVGNMTNQMRDGFGEMEYIDGGKYIGNWKNNKLDGEGKMIYPNGSFYEGKWLEGKRHGYGVMTYSNVDHRLKYEGEWADDTMSGNGTLYFKSGQKYEGVFIKGDYNGYGRFTYADGSVYEGDFFNNKRIGNGKYFWTDGCVYDGEWDNDARCGFGVMTYGDKYDELRYEGSWSDGNESGEGVLYFRDGRKYEGTFANGNYNGHGRFTYADGAIQEGEYKDGVCVSGAVTGVNKLGKKTYGVINGDIADLSENNMFLKIGKVKNAIYYTDEGNNKRAKFTFNDGKIVDVECPKNIFKFNSINKLSAYIEYPDGTVYEGETRSFEPSGYGAIVYPSGDRYEGKFSFGKLQGNGKFIFSDGVEYSGKWKSVTMYDDNYSYEGSMLRLQRNGRGVTRFEDGSIVDGIWRDDKIFVELDRKGKNEQ